MVVSREASSGGRWLLVVLLAFSHMTAFVDRFVMSVVAAPMKTAFSMTETRLGALQGLAFALSYALFIIPFGRLADRLPVRVLILFGFGVWTSSSVACAFTATYEQAFAARMLMGVGQAAFTPAALRWIGSLFEKTEVARPLSVFTAGSTLGKSVALLAGGAALALLSAGGALHAFGGGISPWRGVFVLTAAPNLVLILGFLLVRERALPPLDGPGRPALVGWLSKNAAAFFGHAAVAIAPIILIQAAAAWTPLFYMRYFGLDPVHSALLVGSVVLFAAPTGHLIGGQLTAVLLRRGIAPGALIAAMLIATVPAAAAFCFAPVLTVSLAAYGLMVLLLGAAAPAGLVGVRILTPSEHLGAGNGFFMALVTLVGVGFAPTIVGAMSDGWYGGSQGLNLSLMTLVLLVSLLGVGLAVVFNARWEGGFAWGAPPKLRRGAAGTANDATSRPSTRWVRNRVVQQDK